MTLRVLQVITDPTRRGAQLFADDLRNALATYGDVDVRTVALGPSTAENRLDVAVLGPRRLGRSALVALRRASREVDVVVAHGGQTLPACAVATAATSTPFVYRQVSESLFWASTTARRIRVRAAMSRAAFVVALWDGAATTLQRDFNVAFDRVRVIANAVDAARFAPVDPEARVRVRREHQLKSETFTLVTVGALVPEKGVDVAIAAVAGARAAQLLVVGEGPEEARLRELARRAAPGRVAFTGALADRASAYAAGDAIVLTSRGGDSMPAVLIEASLMGLPAIATPVEAIPEIVRPGSTGALVPIGDIAACTAAIDRWAADGTATAALGSRAREHCLAHFSMDVVAPAWRQLLRDVVAVRGRASGT